MADAVDEKGPPRRLVAGLLLALGVALASTAAILVRLGLPDSLSGEAAANDRAWHTIGIAAGRLGIAALILHVLILARPSWRRLWRRVERRDVAWSAICGLFLAVHFAAWFASLAYTTVAISVTLVTTVPIFVAIAGWILFGERLRWLTMLGIAIAILGSLGIAMADSIRTAIDAGGDTLAAGAVASGDNALLGNLLALLGALAAAGYLLIGRHVRQRLPLVPYIGMIYLAAAIPLVLTAALLGVLPDLLIGDGPWVILALAIGPQLIGHTAFNWAVRWLSATVVSVAILAEPIGSTLLAWWLLHEVPGPIEAAAAGILLAGIAIVSISRSNPKQAPVQLDGSETGA